MERGGGLLESHFDGGPGAQTECGRTMIAPKRLRAGETCVLRGRHVATDERERRARIVRDVDC
jgi:hypothetical protein